MWATGQELCPELQLEPGFYEAICAKAFGGSKTSNPLHVSSERSRFLMRLLMRGRRTPGKSGERPGEQIPELLKAMDGARVNVRGKQKDYRLEKSWLELPVYTSPFSTQLGQVVKRHLPSAAARLSSGS